MVAPFTLQDTVASQAVFRRADGFFRVEPGGWPPGIYVVPVDPPIPPGVLVVTAVCRVISPLADTPAPPAARVALSLVTDGDIMKPTPVAQAVERFVVTEDSVWLGGLPVDLDPPAQVVEATDEITLLPAVPGGPATVPTAGYFFPGGPTFQEPEKWIPTTRPHYHVSLKVQSDGLSTGGLAIMLMYMAGW